MLPEPKQDYAGIDQDSGINSQELFAFLDQESSSWKMFSLFGIEDLELFSETWPYSGMMLHGHLFRHAPWVDHICDGDCSLWPTPTKSMGQRGWGLSTGKFSGKLRAKKSTQERAMKNGYFPHPELIEILLGFPIGMTELEA